MTDFSQLDRQVLSALTTVHAPMARVNGRALRYPSSVSPLSALREYSPAGFADMRKLIAADEVVAFFTPEPIDIPSDWELVRAATINQMTCGRVLRPCTIPLLTLGERDVPEMLALTAATEPGPFAPETIRMGKYFGIRAEDGRLAAMGGQRLQTDQFTEVSAICTDPAFRGRGYAAALVAHITQLAVDQGKAAFLHVFPTNTSAIAVYEKVGFTFRKAIQVTVVKRRNDV